MPKDTIQKSVLINAGAAKVYDVLIKDRYTKEWANAFYPGTYVETDWKPVGRNAFVHSGRTIAGRTCKQT